MYGGAPKGPQLRDLERGTEIELVLISTVMMLARLSLLYDADARTQVLRSA